MSYTPTHVRFDRLQKRHFDPVSKETVLGEGIEKSAGARHDALMYLRRSAAALPTRSTEISLEDADRVSKCLLSEISNISIRLQGSVTTNTHIAVQSDVDVLAITEDFYNVQPPLVVRERYEGNPTAELISLRAASLDAIQSHFWACETDDSGAKCISITGGSLRRKVDVVSANWINSVNYESTGNEIYRGLMVLDNRKRIRVENYPFLHAHELDAKDREAKGLLRPLIRLVKSVARDSDRKIVVSSYDIAALCYAIASNSMIATCGDVVKLALEFNRFSIECIRDADYRATLWVPNRTRKIFAPDGCTIEGLLDLVDELADVISEAASLRMAS